MSDMDRFTIEVQACEIAALSDLIDRARKYLTFPDCGYGLSALGVIHLLNLLNGEDHDEEPVGHGLDEAQ